VDFENRNFWWGSFALSAFYIASFCLFLLRTLFGDFDILLRRFHLWGNILMLIFMLEFISAAVRVTHKNSWGYGVLNSGQGSLKGRVATNSCLL